MRVEIKMDVFNVFNHPNFIANDSNDNISAIGLASLTVAGTVPDPGNPGGFLPITNAGFNCAASCVNPFSGLYLGANGAPLTLNVFRSGRPDKNLQKTNFNSLGNPAADVQNRIIQVALRIRW